MRLRCCRPPLGVVAPAGLPALLGAGGAAGLAGFGRFGAVPALAEFLGLFSAFLLTEARVLPALGNLASGPVVLSAGLVGLCSGLCQFLLRFGGLDQLSVFRSCRVGLLGSSVLWFSLSPSGFHIPRGLGPSSGVQDKLGVESALFTIPRLGGRNPACRTGAKPRRGASPRVGRTSWKCC